MANKKTPPAHFSDLFESNHKRFGHLVLPADLLDDIQTDMYKDYIRILHLPAGCGESNEGCVEDQAVIWNCGNRRSGDRSIIAAENV